MLLLCSMKALSVILLSILLSSCALFNDGQITPQEKRKAALHLKIGTAHYGNGKYHSALKEFMTANEVSPNDPLILNNLGIGYFALNRLPLSEKYINKALSINPKYTDARINLAKVQIELGLYGEALRNLKLAENDLTYSAVDNIHYHTGLALFKMKQFQPAEERFKLALNKNPNHCYAMFFYGRSLFEKRDYRAASESLDNSIGLCEKFKVDGAHFYSALSHYKINNLNTSSSRLQELLELYPKTHFAKDAKEMLKMLK